MKNKSENLLYMVIIVLVCIPIFIQLLVFSYNQILAGKFDKYQSKCVEEYSSKCFMDIEKKHPIVAKKYSNRIQAGIARSYIYEGKYNDARELCDDILKNETDNEAIYYAQNNLALLDNAQKTEVPLDADYFDPSVNYAKWQKTNKIRVFVEGDRRAEKKFMRIFNMWSARTHDMFIFQPVPDKKQADIVCEFVDSFTIPQSDLGFGLTYLKYKGDSDNKYIKKAYIQIIKSVAGKPMAKDHLNSVILYQTGRALGLYRSPLPLDALYKKTLLNKIEVSDQKYPYKPTRRDVITLLKIYNR